MKLFALATAITITGITGITGIAPAQANDCAGLSEEAEKQCWKDRFNAAGIVNDSKAHDFDANAGNIVTNSDGCEGNRSMRYVKQRTGFLGLGGSKSVPIGCMTDAEANRWSIEQQNARPAYIPPAPTYQAPRTCYSNVIGSQVFTNCY